MFRKHRDWFKNQIELTKKGISQDIGLRLEETFHEIMESGRFNSADKASFMFSASKEINFAEKLSEDKNMLLLFLLHYSACVYHAMQLVAINELPYPRDICFSGTGSKYLNLLDVTEEKENIQKFTEIFAKKTYDKYREIYAKTEETEESNIEEEEDENVFDELFDDGFGNGIGSTDNSFSNITGKISLHFTKEPKEATCFGGIHSFASTYQNVGLGENINTIFLGEIDATKNDLFPIRQLTYEELIDEDGEPKKEGRDLSIKVGKNLEQFLELFLSMNKEPETRFENYNIETNLEAFKKGFMAIKQKELAKGMIYERKNASEGGHTPVRESFFFYPLRAIIRDLALAMAKNKTVANS